MAKIYSITVTNALDGVAWECRACAIESQQPGSACVPCPAGYYIDEETNQCQECPPSTFLSGHHIYGQDACQPCGPGGRSNKVQSMLLAMLEDNQVADLIDVQCLHLWNLANTPIQSNLNLSHLLANLAQQWQFVGADIWTNDVLIRSPTS